MSRAKILVVEDERAQQVVLVSSLQKYYEVTLATNYQEALALLSNEKTFDLILLDIILPDGDGFELCAEFRMNDLYLKTPIIFLSSKEEVQSKVLGFSLGADDYIVKPCDTRELKARIDVRLRERASADNFKKHITRGELDFQLEKQLAHIKGAHQALDLTSLEFKLLLYMANHVDHVLSRAQILDGVWGEEKHVSDRSVDTYVASLRKKLGPLSHYIKSIHGVGYKFTLEDFNARAS